MNYYYSNSNNISLPIMTTVKQLIKFLSTYPPDAIISTNRNELDMSEVYPISLERTYTQTGRLTSSGMVISENNIPEIIKMEK